MITPFQKTGPITQPNRASQLIPAQPVQGSGSSMNPTIEEIGYHYNQGGAFHWVDETNVVVGRLIPGFENVVVSFPVPRNLYKRCFWYSCSVDLDPQTVFGYLRFKRDGRIVGKYLEGITSNIPPQPVAPVLNTLTVPTAALPHPSVSHNSANYFYGDPANWVLIPHWINIYCDEVELIVFDWALHDGLALSQLQSFMACMSGLAV